MEEKSQFDQCVCVFVSEKLSVCCDNYLFYHSCFLVLQHGHAVTSYVAQLFTFTFCRRREKSELSQLSVVCV